MREPTLEEALQELKNAIKELIEPPALRIVKWLDRIFKSTKRKR